MGAKTCAARFGLSLGVLCLTLGGLPGLVPVETAAAQQASHAWFGVELAARKDGRPGVLVKHVIHTSPAEAGGIKDGDGILRVGGKTVAAASEVVDEIRTKQPGDAMDVDFERGGHEQRARVTLGVFPGADEILRRDKIGLSAPSLSGIQSVQGVVPATIADAKGKVILIDFWASWCGACKFAAPVVNQWYAKYAAQGLTVIGISNDPADVAQRAALDFGIKYPVAIDRAGTIFPGYGVASLPTMYLIDKKGIVRDVEVGFDPSAVDRHRQLIEALLAEKP